LSSNCGTAEYFILSVLPVILINLTAFSFGGLFLGICSIFLTIPLGVISFCLTVAGIKALILPRTKPGVYSVESWFFVKKWLVDALFTISRYVVHPLYTTIYLPSWLRMLGAKIGERSEISTITQMTPDLTTIGDESFFADGSMVGGRRFYRGFVQFEENKIGRQSFVGNSALLPVGENLGDKCLLGCLSVPPTEPNEVTDGSEWLGSPSFRLPYRQKVEGFDTSETYNPTGKLYIQRYLIDALRIFLPYFIGSTAAIIYFFGMSAAFTYLPLWATLVLAPVAGIALAIGIALGGVLVKKVLMGRFQPVIKPLWSVYVWLNEAVNGVYETVSAPALAPMMGTPFYSVFLRLMGCKVGKYAFIETSRFSEFDLVEIGDYVALNRDVIIQNHLFEDRIMKSSHLKIGDECSIGNMSVVLYDTEMKQGSCIAPLSLLMKGEILPPFSRWVGIPTSLAMEIDCSSTD
jgi:non-ribosomal peptide synthetase-like protein